jgi:hypothetical protein
MQSDALARNGQRAGQERVPEAVVRRMAHRLEAPDPSHNDWERNTAVLPSEKLPPLEAAHVRRLLPRQCQCSELQNMLASNCDQLTTLLDSAADEASCKVLVCCR